MSDPSKRSKHHGTLFAPPLHSRAEGPTDPSTIKLPSPFVAVVIGASRGIGAGTATAYARAGASGIMITSRNESSCHDTAKNILAIKPDAKVLCQSADVTNEESMREAADAARTVFGRVDVCVINAGTGEPVLKYPETGEEYWPHGIVEGTTDTFINIMNTNVIGPYLTAKFFIPLMEETAKEAGRSTSLVVVSSAAAHFSESDTLPISYSLSKMAVTRLIQQIQDWHGKASPGVNAFAVHPGGVMTEMAGSIPNRMFDPYDPGLCGGFTVWVTSDPSRAWLAGRWLSTKWDTAQLESMKDEIVSEDKLKFRMAV